MFLYAWAVIAALAFFCTSCADPAGSSDTETAIVESGGDSVIASLNAQIKENPDDPFLYHERARRLLANDQPDMAFNDVRRAISIDSLETAFFMTLGEIYFIKGEGTRSLQAYEHAVELAPENTDAILKVAELLLYLNNPPKAIETIDQALRIDKYNAKAYFMKGMAFKELRDTIKALSSFQTAVEQDPEYFHGYMQLGTLLAEQHDPLAGQYFLNAINANPTSIEAHYALAMFRQEHGDPQAALGDYENILAIDSTYRDAIYNSGFVYSELLAQPKEALAWFERVVRFYPEDYAAWYMQGLMLERLGDKTGALSAYKRSLEINPQYELAAMGRSRVE